MALEFREADKSSTEIVVYSHKLHIATLRKQTKGALWGWSFAFTAGPAGFKPHGHADTFDEAKTAIEQNWRAWLRAAGLNDH